MNHAEIVGRKVSKYSPLSRLIRHILGAYNHKIKSVKKPLLWYLTLIKFLSRWQNSPYFEEYKMKTLTFTFTLRAVALAVLFAVGDAYAVGSTTANLTVSATIAEVAKVIAEPADFGTVDLKKAEYITNTHLTVQLPAGSATVIMLDQGAHPSATSQDAVPQRQMLGANGAKLAYTISQANGSIWGNTNDTGMTYVGTNSSEALTVPIKIVDNQNVPPGAYSDTINVTIKY
ncbi:MAG: hypothetical protein RIR39_2051 [Pseudomonadota bacterium]|jgi:spore coat protein U-like protein